MKKNKMMRAASALLVAVLLTTSVISGTFAKYVTEDSGSDNARVAHWGVTITPQGTIFAQNYATDDTTYQSQFANSVESSNTDKVVAPGTTGNNTLVLLEGTPEVAYKVEYTPTLTLNGWTVGADEYCPVIFTVEGEEYYIGKTDISSVAELKEAVEDAIKACNDAYAPKTNLEEANINYPAVTWKWEFKGTDYPVSGYQTDTNDTALGNQAAGLNGGTPATISLIVVTTVTQID